MWGHISYGVTTHVYRREAYYSVENYPKSSMMERRRYTVLIPDMGKRVSGLEE